MMSSKNSLSTPSLLSSIVIRFRSIALIIFNFWMNGFVNRLTRVYHLVKYFGRYIQRFFQILSGSHYSLVNFSDGDFSVGGIADQIFKEEKDWNNPHIGDLFHIYLSKILYEEPDRIKDQCADWGFGPESIEILTYIQDGDLKKYSYSTEAVVLKHDQSKTIIIAFRGTEPMDLLQWLTDASTNFLVIDKVFNDVNNDDDPIRVHAGFYSALGLSEMNPFVPIDFDKVTSKSPMFVQLLKSIRNFNQKHEKCQISITGHSLGGGLASLFSFVLSAYGYESSISGVYTYGQPLVGNRRYAQILNHKLGNRIHRWVNHSDIVTRVPVIELPSIAWYYGRTPYSDALEVAGNNNPKEPSQENHRYYHSGFRFRISHEGNLLEDSALDKGPIRGYEDELDLFHLIYSTGNAIHSLLNISPIRSLLWLTMPTEINDHFPGDYARKIKKILKGKK